MDIVEKNLYITYKKDEVDYFYEGVEEWAKEAYEDNLSGSEIPPLIDNVLVDYQELIIDNSYTYVQNNFGFATPGCSEEEIEDMQELIEETLFEESFGFLEEFCEAHSLTTLRKVYDGDTFQVVFIGEFNSPQVKVVQIEEEY